MYKVIKYFTDIEDNNYPYKEGDIYPREGLSVLPSRIEKLLTSNNRRKEPFIKEVEEPKPKAKPKKTETEENTEE